LINRPYVKGFWDFLERMMVPRLRYAYTVCDSIARIYSKKYNVPFRVVRNFPPAGFFGNNSNGQENDSSRMILYQGALNVGRGLPQAILAMKFIKDARLVIAGDGNIKATLEKLVEDEDLHSKVKFLGRLPVRELAGITPLAAAGLSIEEDMGLNYRYALPNKLFDYIQARVPVIVTDLPEMSAVVDRYKVGEVITSLRPENLAGVMENMLNDKEKRRVWKQNLEIAAGELTWENEEKTLKEIFQPFL
jgi:glycosyltransferase involved in cell wall biosynthesis